MLERTLELLPETVYPREPWALVERDFQHDRMAVTESLFAISNGFIGMRGVPDEGRPFSERGVLVNGLHEQWPIHHPERAFGFAELGQTIIAAPESRRIHLYIDDEPFELGAADLTSYERRLDFRSGQLQRTATWRLPSGAEVRLSSASLVSLVQRHLVATRYSLEVLSGRINTVISSQMPNSQDRRDNSGDPRLAHAMADDVLMSEGAVAEGLRTLHRFRVKTSGMTMSCGIDHVISGDGIVRQQIEARDDLGRLVVEAELSAGERVELTKFASYHTSAVNHGGSPTETSRLADRAARTLDRAMRSGWEAIATEQRQHLDSFWADADVIVECDDPAVQQGVRWALFHLLQASARADSRGIPAKGLTGSAYEGHYFWDADIYVMPFLSYVRPSLARNLLRFRHGMLDHARHRALQVNQQGALFPWRTITGDEASAFFEAGTAQYHINADIAHAVTTYVARTGDEDFMAQQGAEMLVETARLWADLGFFRTEDGVNAFHIHGVTGPDEYTTVVDDNAYTNLMAAANLRAAADAVEWLERERPEALEALERATALRRDEAVMWRKAADAMFVPYDDELGITPQDAHFLQLQRWPAADVPPEKYPLLLHFHPLVIYRYQVIKQADVVLAMLLQDHAFPLDLQERNFDYYDQLTTGDSSLSTAIQAIIAARIGRPEKALEFFREGLFMDLADVHDNAGAGVHVAAAGGVWMSLVNGFGGLSESGSQLSFDPRLPDSWTRLRFTLRIAGRRLQVEVTHDATTFEVDGDLDSDDSLSLTFRGRSVTVVPGSPSVCT